jgi:DNA-binding GntR family transcriptional regulator
VSGSSAGPIGRERLSDQAYRQIRDAIIALQLEPGAPLVDKALSEWLGIGLTPVRDALKRLTLERLAVSYPARGTYVSAINIADESQLTEVRVQLEGLAASLAAERATPAQKQTLLELVADLELEFDNRSAHTELDVRVHRAVYAATRNEFLEATLNQYANLAMRIWNLGLNREPVEMAHVRSQRDVVDAVVRGDPLGARQAAEQHLLGFSTTVRTAMRPGSADGSGRSSVS